MMPSFKYKGRDKQGQMVEGLIEAQSPNNAVLKLASVDVIPPAQVTQTVGQFLAK